MNSSKMTSSTERNTFVLRSKLLNEAKHGFGVLSPTVVNDSLEVIAFHDSDGGLSALWLGCASKTCLFCAGQVRLGSSKRLVIVCPGLLSSYQSIISRQISRRHMLKNRNRLTLFAKGRPKIKTGEKEKRTKIRRRRWRKENIQQGRWAETERRGRRWKKKSVNGTGKDRSSVRFCEEPHPKPVSQIRGITVI